MLQSGENSFAAEVIGRLAQKYGFDSDTAMAKHLGVTRQTVGNWRTRDSLDYKLLLDKFPGADLNWLFRGQVSGVSSTDDALRALYLAGHRVTLEPLGGTNAEV